MKKYFMAIILLVFLLCSVSYATTYQITFAWDHEGADAEGFKIYATQIPGVYDSVPIIDIPHDQAMAASGYVVDTDFISPDGESIKWFFVATAYDAVGNESGMSNEVDLVIDFEAPGDPYNFSVTIKVVE